MSEAHRTPADSKPEEFKRFEELARRVLTVPKSEVDRLRARGDRPDDDDAAPTG